MKATAKFTNETLLCGFLWIALQSLLDILFDGALQAFHFSLANPFKLSNPVCQNYEVDRYCYLTAVHGEASTLQ